MKRQREETKQERNPAKEGRDRSARFERLLKATSELATYTLRLYITGSTLRSAQAVANIRKLCEEYLPGRYNLEVVDIYQQPGRAASAQIIAAPTLVKVLPHPVKRLIGNLANRDKVIVGLNLRGNTAEKGSHWSTV